MGGTKLSIDTEEVPSDNHLLLKAPYYALWGLIIWFGGNTRIEFNALMIKIRLYYSHTISAEPFSASEKKEEKKLFLNVSLSPPPE